MSSFSSSKKPNALSTTPLSSLFLSSIFAPCFSSKSKHAESSQTSSGVSPSSSRSVTLAPFPEEGILVMQADHERQLRV